jgi:hypothetical protein
LSEAERVGEHLGTLGIDPPPVSAGALPTAGLRCPWDETHVDLFFSYEPEFFASVEHRVEHHAFEDSEGRLFDLPFLSAEDLSIFKVLFDRQKDWADIEAMLEEAPLDLDYVQHWLLQLQGERIRPELRRIVDLSASAAAARGASGSG